MKVALITPGAGGMYCGSCLNDNALASALVGLGHEATLIPIYTPIRTDEHSVSIDRVFYGAVNVYLEQKSALFRHTPRLIDKLFNGRGLLNWAAGRAGTTDPRELGELAHSMLLGEDGRQRKELDELVGWLRDTVAPDVVHLSNSMLGGMARTIRERVGVPVVCSIQGEDIFLDELPEPHRARVLDTLRLKAGEVDGFITPSRYYAEAMGPVLGLPRERVHHVPLGINLEGFDAEPPPRSGSPFVVAYLARICPEKGLHLLVEAFGDLVRERGGDGLRLEIAGYLGPRDTDYFAGIMERVKQRSLEPFVNHRGEVDRREKIALLDSAHVLSVPTTYREPKGRFVLEALARGLPVVQPSHGAFPELIEATGGGVLFEPGSAESLARGLGRLIDDPSLAAGLGRAGRDAVRRRYGARSMAEASVEVYRRYTGPAKRG